jgi:cyclic pyranopterin phosphate synthase
MNELTHITPDGDAIMVDVSEKKISHRSATAQAFIIMQPETLALIQQGKHKKGDVLAVARIAGIQGAKKCSDLIPLCHPLMLSSVKIEIDSQSYSDRIKIMAHCKIAAQTGVEMEALTAASTAALTIYDMCKAVDKTMQVDGLCVLKKTGGKSGDWAFDPNS